jgi:hypothetical protein
MSTTVPACARHTGAAVIRRGARRSLSEGADVLGRNFDRGTDASPLPRTWEGARST